jgi:hypothetical protein
MHRCIERREDVEIFLMQPSATRITCISEISRTDLRVPHPHSHNSRAPPASYPSLVRFKPLFDCFVLFGAMVEVDAGIRPYENPQASRPLGDSSQESGSISGAEQVGHKDVSKARFGQNTQILVD